MDSLLLLSNKEYLYMRKHKLNLETRYHVKLILPEVDVNNGYCANDIMFATIYGEETNIGIVKEVLRLKMVEFETSQDLEISSSDVEDNVPMITLSDSDSATTITLSENNKVKKKKQTSETVATHSVSSITEASSNCNEVLRLTMEELGTSHDLKMSSSNVGDNVPMITLSDSDTATTIKLPENKKVKRKRKKKKKQTSEMVATHSVSSIREASSNCNPSRKRKLSHTISSITELTSFDTTSEKNCTGNIQEKEEFNKFKRQLSRPLVSVNQSTTIATKTIITSSTVTSQNANDSIVLLDGWAPIDEFIPLNNKFRKNKRKRKDLASSIQTKNNDSVVILDDDNMAVPRPISKDVKRLRPIVIDGNNVARYHGKASQTFSSKGIQICVDYFLKRGHTQITVFVPLFRRHKTFGQIPTTDPFILEDLEKSQRLVFTPSKNMNGRRMMCYDDRFIVELASTTDGVILSNDNYKDLLDVKEFKKTIEERVLMFVFVGDKLMIPNDPMGKNGPLLDDFLSFP